MGQRIALMHEGKMQMLDTPANVYNRPANVFTAKFIGSPSMNIVEASYTRGTLVIGRQVVWLPDMWSGLASRNESGRLFLGIRPEHMILHRRRPRKYPGGNRQVTWRITATGTAYMCRWTIWKLLL